MMIELTNDTIDNEIQNTANVARQTNDPDFKERNQHILFALLELRERRKHTDMSNTMLDTVNDNFFEMIGD